MAQPQLLQIKLSRFDAQPWGFRLQGGVDFAQPLLVQKVNAGSLSEQAGLQPGDAVIKINDVDVFNFRHKDAQDIVVRSGNNFVITVQRGGSTWRPQVTPTGNVPQPNSPYLQTVTKTSLAHKQQDSQHIGCGYNNAARPFANGGDGGVKSIVNKQYNTPVGIYSDESIAETLSAQAEVLAGGVLGVNFKKNEKEYQADRSEVLKFLREEETGQSTPEPHSPANFYWTQSHAIGGNERRTPLHHQHQQDERIGVPLQSNTLAPEAPHRPSLPVAQKKEDVETEQPQQEDPRIIVLPICPALQGPEYKAEMEAAAAALASDHDGRPRPLSASGHPACQLCGVGIVGVFVRIKDKNLHVECFKCATCGTSLKNQGYYNFNNKLYCDIHAKQAALNNPPAGTEGYVPVPIKPNTKLSANTISSALNSHGYAGASNGYSNGSSAPAPAPPESEPSQELPLPPPPSPTQLLQYAEADHQVSPEQQHNRTHSSLSSISTGSSSSGVGGSGSGSGCGSGSASGVGPQSQQSYSSTLSLDRFSSPLHSRQTSSSSTSLEVGGLAPSPPPPPPPLPTAAATATAAANYRLQGQQNENDMNTQNQNKGHNAYNQMLKEYSNKLQQQPSLHPNTTQHTPPTQRHNNSNNNNTAKPFAAAHQQQQQPLVAALTATLANQLKFNPHQVASPQAAAPAVAPGTPAAASTPLVAPATVDSSPATIAVAATGTATTADTMSANVADEPSSIYGQINANPAAPGLAAISGGGDQPFEYVTLTGNVIRSVQAPGKGAGINYKVNQGYARPYGAAAPKSPVSYPPQQQQQSPRPAPGGNNPYATLPRSNVGQQVPPQAYSAVIVTAPASAPAPAPVLAPASAPAPVPSIALPAPFSVNTSSNAYSSTTSKFDAHELIEETVEELEHSEILFPPPSPLSHLTKQGKAVQSGLHKADNIPKYQRNWTVLPTQSPIRTPEPQELRENVPLAFVDAPKAAVTSDSSTVHRPIARAHVAVPPPSITVPTTVVSFERPQLSVPIIVEGERAGPVTMAFQPLDEFVRPDQAQTPTRPYTPSMTQKPAPIVPFYQTEEKLCFDECPATHARDYDMRAASPFPDRARSPAPGPPPNPLSAIRAPRMKEPESNLLSVSGGAARLQTGSITTGQSYQGQLLAHSEQTTQSARQSFTQQPERITEQRMGSLSIQQREQSSQLQQQSQSQSQSQTRSQVGNTQIERRRKVTEEFERTQSAKTIEIRTGSQSQSVSQSQAQSVQSQSESTERRSSYGKTGFVATQARRLSGLEQEITSLTSQSQAISARASTLGESCFPQLRSPTFDSKFPLKPAPAQSTVPGYGAAPSSQTASKLVAPPPGFLQQQQVQQQQIQQQQQQRSAYSSVQQSSKTSTSSLSSSSAASASQSLTQASSAITTTTNNQATSAFRRTSNGSSIIKPNLASRPSIASITAPAPAPARAPNAVKAPIAPKSVIANVVQSAAAPPPSASAPAVFPPDLSDLNLNSNADGSAGPGGKSTGAFGATSAPKRGRGILNKAAAPGVRIPLCNSCNVQIRGPFITALGRIWCPDHFICVNGNCRRPLQDIGFVEEKGDLYCEYCFEKYLAPTCSKCAGKIKGDCLNAIGKHFHPECFTCGQCGKIFGNTPFFLEDGQAYCEADWNELFTTKCFACGFPVEAGDRWVEALNHNYHSQCFNCTFCKQNLEGQSFYNKGGRPFCKNHAR
ncbi:PDZ and LIM domain protein Zasp isoform X7 [Drosophila ananassae]|uniref:PDZ and LIM domain protein Zasp isoform X7 n=1 Tax=Drosophila ananassae TaxID=7217 RepID=UPI001CFFCB9C|nr:PDZ and LIM domain protein Zasp isoform X7 [Drosophila ananassae]